MTKLNAIASLERNSTSITQVVARLKRNGCMKPCLRRNRSTCCPIAQWLKKKTGRNYFITFTAAWPAPQCDAQAGVTLSPLLRRVIDWLDRQKSTFKETP